MTAPKQIIFLFCILLPLLTSAENIENQTFNETNTEKEALEKQKEDLYRQIKTAINDSINILEESDANDTDASALKSFIDKLEKQVEVLGGKNTTEQVYDNLVDIGDTRRRGKSGKKKKYHVKRRSKGQGGYESDKGEDKKELDVLGAIFEDRLQKNKGKRGKERILNRYLMEQKVAEWMKAKAEEKKRIQQLVISKMSGPKPEGCPNWGKDKKLKSKSKKKGSPQRDGVVPCCRKCCKHSYMGCLKK